MNRTGFPVVILHAISVNDLPSETRKAIQELVMSNIWEQLEIFWLTKESSWMSQVDSQGKLTKVDKGCLIEIPFPLETYSDTKAWVLKQIAEILEMAGVTGFLLSPYEIEFVY